MRLSTKAQTLLLSGTIFAAACPPNLEGMGVGVEAEPAPALTLPAPELDAPAAPIADVTTHVPENVNHALKFCDIDNNGDPKSTANMMGTGGYYACVDLDSDGRVDIVIGEEPGGTAWGVTIPEGHPVETWDTLREQAYWTAFPPPSY